LFSYKAHRAVRRISSSSQFAFHGSGIFAQGSRAVALGPMIKRLLACIEVFVLAMPGA
jgi:hypothetical protein